MDPRPLAAVVLALLVSSASGCTNNPAFDPPTGEAAASDPGGPAASTADPTTSPATSPTTSPTTTASAEDSTAASTGPVTFSTSGDVPSAADTSTNATATSSTGDDTGDSGLASTGADETMVVLKASKTYGPSMFFPGELELVPPRVVLLPPALMVTVGNAGNHQATLKAVLADMSLVTCTFTGGSSQSDPAVGTTEWDKGQQYLLTSCDDGSQAGSMLEVGELRLEIANGASTQPPGAPQTTAIATLPAP